MNTEERKAFWDKLLTMHDRNPDSIEALMNASKPPQYLCRFRSVSKNSLQQLQDNKLFFSTADYYDDPFDTYFYIDFNRMKEIYKIGKQRLQNLNSEFIIWLNSIANQIGINASDFIKELSDSEIDFERLKGQLTTIRSNIQKSLYSICFCEDPLNETVWLKYASNHEGFVQIYDMDSSDTYLCGKEATCNNCIMFQQKPYIYPVYYSDIKYDASNYTLALLMLKQGESGERKFSNALYQIFSQCTMWEAERISLNKKKCHENDLEWRMIRPAIMPQRSFIKMKPCKVIVGLRMPEYERRLVQSAAKVAGIQNICEAYINDSDVLDSRPLEERM